MFKLSIPKFIHQTWKTTRIPDHWQAGHQKWKDLHPDWTHILWTDADIDAFMKLQPEYNQWRNFYWPIQRVDIWRYFALREYGGIYSDLDMFPEKAVFFGSGNVFVVPSANTPNVFTNALMASDTSSNSRLFWTSVIDEVFHWHSKVNTYVKVGAFFSRHLEIMVSTGPLALTRAVQKSFVNITVLPRRLWNPYDLSKAGDINDQNNDTIIKIVEGSSWHELDSTVLSTIFIYKSTFLVILALVIIAFSLQGLHSFINLRAMKSKIKSFTLKKQITKNCSASLTEIVDSVEF